MKVSAIVAALVLVGSGLPADDPGPGEKADDRAAPSPFPDGYLDHEALGKALRQLRDEHPRTVSVTSLAKSGRGREVWLATVGLPIPPGEPPRPAILIVANLEADHLVGSQVALGLVDRIVRGDDPDLAGLAERATIYVVPRLNPDGAERLLTSPRADLRTNLTPVDRDRDGRRGEDGPDDLDGDGLVTRMRARDARATLVPDAKDARILRKADAIKGERGVYSEYPEGKDDDGDGQVNEDPAGGVNLNRNWPHRWTEFDPEAGFGPASEPEVHGLIQFAFDHPEIVAVWSLSLNDNLRSEPKKPGTTIDDADLPLFAELSRLYNAALKSPAEAAKEAEAKPEPPKEQARAAPEEGARAKGRRGPSASPGQPTPAASPGLDGTTDGALSEWAYHQYGSLGLASRPWSGPDLPEPAEGQPGPPADGEARWLYWNDHVMGGRAFVPLHPFDHPTLGRVEVGGWKPGVRLNPPIERIDAIADAHLAFFKELTRRLPRLAIGDVKAESKGGGLYQVAATVSNEGGLPTALAQGVRVRKAPPVLVRLKVGDGKILAGKALNRVDSLAGSGGRQEFRWLIQAPDSVKSITLEAVCPKAGRAEKVIDL